MRGQSTRNPGATLGLKRGIGSELEDATGKMFEAARKKTDSEGAASRIARAD
jgi:hypothetical protein